MIIEAIKLAAEFNRYFTSANGVDVPAKVSVSRDEWRALFTAIQQAEAQQPATGEPVASRNPFASRCYTMSESHLSGHRLIVGFEKLGDVQDAHEWVARQGRGDFTHPAPIAPVTTEPVEDGIRNAEDELNYAEEVLDAITCEFSDGEFPVTDFNCIGDYITAVVDVFKERLAAQQPATPEPVGQVSDLFPSVRNKLHAQGLDADAPLYTHPAPSVLDVDFELQELREIERAMDDFADCGETDVVDTLLLRAVQAGFLECTHFHVANRGALQEAIDAAMLAAK